MRIRFDRFPGGLRRALTFSYDDGRVSDRRLVRLFNRCGLRATFHLNSGRLDGKGFVCAAELPALYAGHEVAAHTVDHPHLHDLSPAVFCAQVLEDRRALESITGGIVGGLSYPYGEHPGWARDLLPGLGVGYCRTIRATRRFDLPDDLLLWHPTAHHREGIESFGEAFLAQDPRNNPALLFVWGHSHDLESEEEWRMLERFCEGMGGRDDVWYATCAEIASYVRAMRALCVSADGRRIDNPSALDVWLSVDGAARCVEGGKSIRIGASGRMGSLK